MAKYNVNLIFKDASITLNEVITRVLKMELQNKFNMTCNYLDEKILDSHIHYSQVEVSNN